MHILADTLALFHRRSAALFLALFLALTLALSFGGAGVAADLSTHAGNVHASQLACGGINGPPCG